MDRLNFRPCATWVLAAIVLTMTGCSFFPESLQPHNLQKLNRGSGYSSDPFFSEPPFRHYVYSPHAVPVTEGTDESEGDQ